MEELIEKRNIICFQIIMAVILSIIGSILAYITDSPRNGLNIGWILFVIICCSFVGFYIGEGVSKAYSILIQGGKANKLQTHIKTKPLRILKCTMCGGTINSETLICEYCGNKYIK